MNAITTFEDGLKLARQQVRILQALGYQGLLCPKRSQKRIELLAAKGRQTVHMTFHPGGVEVELLPTGSLNKARAMSEA